VMGDDRCWLYQHVDVAVKGDGMICRLPDLTGPFSSDLFEER
jgi:hypothetical protein